MDLLKAWLTIKRMFITVVVLLAIIATITAVPAVHYSKDVEVQKTKWAAFKTDFKKVYDNKEEVSHAIALTVSNPHCRRACALIALWTPFSSSTSAMPKQPPSASTLSMA